MADNNGLPDGFEFNEYFSATFEAGGEILRKYCRSCTGRKTCKMQEGIRTAMGENYPLWFEAHVPVRTTTRWLLSRGEETHVFCNQYRSPQQNLPGIEKDHIDGISRLLEVSSAVTD